MRRLVVSELITLDGVVEAGGAPTPPGWAGDLMSSETGAHRLREVVDAGSLCSAG